MDEISLSEALWQLRSELYQAQTDGAGQQLRFEVEKAELELEVEFRRDGNGKVKVSVGALGAKGEAEAGGARGAVRRERLTLTLNVLDGAVGPGARFQVERGAPVPGAYTGTPGPAYGAQPSELLPPEPWDE
ncbi:trypco2 family protein [Kitasatospora sp. NPDC048540]|uniref:trypco2 family protein n=1 Tax=unclassified Kitasatospora TaxID=2633591 RepID=UPI00068D186D|nr:trypco2 family protein [Kitasatospora sp. MBT63]